MIFQEYFTMEIILVTAGTAKLVIAVQMSNQITENISKNNIFKTHQNQSLYLVLSSSFKNILIINLQSILFCILTARTAFRKHWGKKAQTKEREAKMCLKAVNNYRNESI